MGLRVPAAAEMEVGNVPKVERSGWSLRQWSDETGDIGRSTIYRLLDEGRIKSVKVGGRRVILTSPREYLEAAVAEAEQAA